MSEDLEKRIADDLLKTNRDSQGNLVDVVCKCGHWVSEHDDGRNSDYPIYPCMVCLCDTFEFSAQTNLPSEIEGLFGDDHDDGCICALCRYNQPHCKIERAMNARRERRG